MTGQSRNGRECTTTTNEIDVENEPPLKKNAEDTKIFCNEFSKELQYIYFGVTDDESNDSENFWFSDIDFFI